MASFIAFLIEVAAALLLWACLYSANYKPYLRRMIMRRRRDREWVTKERIQREWGYRFFLLLSFALAPFWVVARSYGFTDVSLGFLLAIVASVAIGAVYMIRWEPFRRLGIYQLRHMPEEW